jgi:HAD superfamily hydrolase (TIGR01549 family)
MWEIFASLCGDAGVRVEPADCERLVRHLWSSGQAHAESQVRAGAQHSDSDEEFALIFQQLGRIIFTQMGVQDGQDELMQRFFQAFWIEENWALFPEVLEALRALRRAGLRLGVLSNAPSNLPRFLDRLGVSGEVDFVVVSAIEGMKKPDRRIFEVALRRAGTAPSETLHVGDMYIEDVLGGRSAGLQTLLIERGQRSLFPSFRESCERQLEPESVINDLTELVQRLP